MFTRVLFLSLVSTFSWAETVIQSASPNVLPTGRAAEVRMRVSDGMKYQFVIMPGRPYVKQALPVDYRIRDMAVHHGHGLLAAGERGLLIADLTASGKINISASHVTKGKTTRVLAEKKHAWLVDDGTEVVMLDIRNLKKPAVLARYHSDQTITDITIHDGCVYLLLGSTTIAAIDMRNPPVSVELSRFALEDEAKKIFASGDRLYAAQPGYGLSIFDTTDKAHIRLVGRQTVTGGATAVTVQDDIALVARGGNGFTLFDATDPAHAKWLGSHSRLGQVAGISARDGKVVLWNDSAELISMDTGNPGMPVIAASHRDIGADTANWLNAVWLDDKTVLAASPSALQSIDFSATPPLFSNENLDAGQGVNLGGERRLFIAGDIAYVADWFSGLHLYDISTPSRPRLLSSFHTPGSAKGVVVRDGYAYVADDDHGLQVVDVRDPLHPAHVSSLATNGLAYTPRLSGNLLYLAGHRGGFQIIDVSDAKVPKLVADIQTPGKAWSLDVAGNTLFIADDTAGVLVFDVSDATHPVQVGVFDPDGAAEDVVVRGDTAYVACFDKGFYVLDISDPAQPRQIGHTPTPGNARGIALKDDFAYVSDWFAGMQVIDVSDKTVPAIVGEYDTSGAAWGIGIKADHAYIGDWWGGFAVLDISNPNKPVQVDRYQSRGKVMQIAAQGKFAYAAMDNGGVQIFDVTNPLNPTWMTSVEIDGNPTGLLLDGTMIFVAVGSGKDSGLVTVDVSDPFQARRLGHIPVKAGVQHISNEAGRLYFSNGRGLGVIDIRAPDQVRAWHKHAANINDLRVEGGRIFLATGQGMEVLDERFKLKMRYKTKHPAGMVRVHGKKAFLYGDKLGMRVLDVSGTKVRPVSSFEPVEKLSGMTADGDVLYATGTNGNLLEIDISSLKPIRIRGIYPLARPATGIKIIDGVAMLAGNDIITSVKLLPPVALVRRADREIRMLLPKELPAGSYDAVAIAPDGKRNISHGVLNISMPAFSKPEITPEEFQRLLQEQQKESAHNAPAR
ncbi:MAG: hypothetical protein WA635_12025 [Gallionella sp.]